MVAQALAALLLVAACAAVAKMAAWWREAAVVRALPTPDGGGSLVAGHVAALASPRCTVYCIACDSTGVGL
jgi:hypothetical protein